MLPGFLAILALSILYAGYQDTTFVEALFYGLAPAVLAIVAAAVIRVARRALTDRTLMAVAALSFGALFFLTVPFPLVIAAAGLFGYGRSRLRADGAAGAPQQGHEPVRWQRRDHDADPRRRRCGSGSPVR